MHAMFANVHCKYSHINNFDILPQIAFDPQFEMFIFNTVNYES